MGASKVLLLHGFTQTARCWGEFAELLIDAGHDVVVVDLPGHGSSTDDPMNVTETARLLGERHGAATWLGYSFGGRIALRLALDRPDLARRLILIGATPGLETLAERAERFAADEALAASIDRDGLASFLDRWLALPLFADVPQENVFREERLRNSASSLAASLRAAGTGAMEPMWSRLATLRTPTLLITGQRDEKFASIADRMASSIGSNAQRSRIADAGHSSHLSQPQATAAAVLDWLAATSQP